jgi:hypothetical protein
LIMYWHIRDLWSPTNLVALMVVESYDTLPYLQDEVRIVHGPPTDAHLVIVWKTCTRVR